MRAMNCEKCGTVASDVRPVEILVGRRTHSSPAEYDEVMVCGDCCDRADHEASMDAFDHAYARATANGWSD